MSGQRLEQICVSSTIKGRKLLICAIYIPPDRSQDVGVINDHLASMNELCNKCSNDDVILTCGAYNQPHMRWRSIDNVIQCDSSQLPSSSSTLLDGMDYLCLNQRNLVHNPLDRILDLIFCSPDIDIDVYYCPASLLPLDSHHPSLEIYLPARVVCVEAIERRVDRPLNFRTIDFAALLAYLSTVDWDMISAINDVNEMAERFNSILNDWLVTNVPRIKPPVSPVWSSHRLRTLKRARNACQRQLRRQRTLTNRQCFQQASNAYRSLNASLYKNYVFRVQSALKTNPRSFWHFVNSKRKNSVIPMNVHLNDITATSATESSQLFAEHLASVFAENPASRSEIEEAIRDVPVDMVDLGIFVVNPEMVSLAAEKLKRSLTPGPDGLPAVVICRCIAILA
ncbi:uncharacterized protein LOC129774200 [Toxorhynchites rutilus septentrionalis]|uniref:uncharacterized protein LOC129774200 n=1 Tax=Toxorhynchites rutilus septentrionalis TaxID=329112 RepID=UPI0024798F12|nr:uncharacterized protein LOC129774200 [Toxorhynchites rutilus septentrionalis]